MPSAATVDFFSDINKTLSLYRVDEKTCAAIRAFAKEADVLIPEFLETVEEWLTSNSVFKVIYESESSLRQFHDNKKRYWKEFFAADINKAYIDSRLDMGRYYSHINLSLNAYCALISFKLTWWLNVVEGTKRSAEEKKHIAESIKRLILLDTGATCVAYTEANNRIIEQQSNTLLQLSTPTIQLWEGILLLPIVGVLDSIRAQNMMESLLQRIVITASPISILDIVGVPNVDSSVANHLIKIIRATKLLGNTCILSGISPEVAQTLVEVGVDLEGINTTSNLRNALKVGLDLINLTINEKKEITQQSKEKEIG